MIESQLLSYRQPISIKNQRSNRYITIDQNTSKLSASGSHPFLQINETPLEMSPKVLWFFQQKQMKDLPYYKLPKFGLRWTTHIQIIDFDPRIIIEYMVCSSSGDVRAEKMSATEAMASKNTKFTLLDPNNFQSKRQVTLYDDIVFKFNETNYLISELNHLINWNGTQVSIDSSWKIHKSTSPPMPDWLYLRPNISLSFLSPQQEAILPQTLVDTSSYLVKQDERRTLGSHPQQAQQLYLIEDLLFCMMGVEGSYIRRRCTQGIYSEYAIEPNLSQPTCDISLQHMVNKILPLCSQHDAVEFYVQHKSRYDNGLVSQALCSGIRNLLKEYLTLVNQLDAEFNNEDLTLQKLWYYLQPTLKIIGALGALVDETAALTGGVLLGKLFDLTTSSSDSQVTSVYVFLAERAAVPYLEIMSKWLYEGEVTDIYEEFLVQERKTQQKSQLSSEYRDSYWETRFTLRNGQVPKFLEKYKDLILRTGKYLNVVRESNRNNGGLNPERELESRSEELIRSQDFSAVVLKAFEYANRQILELLFRGEDLMGRLRTIKRFFMMESGDFFIHFLELAEDELMKMPKMISNEKLESLLDMAVRSTSCSDPYKEDISGNLDSYTVMEQVYALQNLRGGGESILSAVNGQQIVHSSGSSLRGVDLFTIDLRINWPINLVLSRTSMVKYQIIFKSLFFFKYIERQLNKTWMLHQTVKELGIQGLFIKSHILLQQMIHFIKSYLFYVSYDVIEQNYTLMEQKLTTLDTFEEVLTNHNQFLESVLHQSLLLDQAWMKGFNRLTQCCLTFAKAMQRFTTTLTRNDNMGFNLQDDYASGLLRRKQWIQSSKEHVKQIITEQSYNNTVSSFQQKFVDLSKELTKMIYQKISSQNNFLTGLVTRLDFEGQYAGIQGQVFQSSDAPLFFKLT